MFFEGFFTALAAASAFAAGVLWIIATKAEVPAPAETYGVGSLLGGYLITMNAKKERIDLHATYVAQSKWNGYAAIAASISGFLAVAAFGAHFFGK